MVPPGFLTADGSIFKPGNSRMDNGLNYRLNGLIGNKHLNPDNLFCCQLTPLVKIVNRISGASPTRNGES